MFQYDDKWDVDKTTESLNTSLFGKSKKSLVISSVPANNGSQVRVTHDSDSEEYSKNDRKRLKKWRKKNRSCGNIAENGCASLQQSNSVAFLSKKNIKSSNNYDEQKLKVNTFLNMSLDLEDKKVKQKMKDISTNIHLPEKKSRKRKCSLSDDTDKNVLSNENKKTKVEQNKNSTLSTIDAAASGKERRKRKQNRKKKNNSKKNKYKHLALNSASKTRDLDISSQGNESTNRSTKKEYVIENSGHQALEPSAYKQENLNQGYMHNNKVISPQKQNLAGGSHSNILNVYSFSENKNKKSKKRTKHLLHDVDSFNKIELPVKNVKRMNDNSNCETGNSSQSQPIKETAGFEKLSLATSNVSLKNKQILQKMFNVNKQEIGNENSQVDLLLNKKKRNLHEVVKKNSEHSYPDTGSNDDLPQIEPQENKFKTNQWKERQQCNVSEKSTAYTVFNKSQSIWGKAAELGQQAKEKLNSARFRYINEQLYSCKGNEAMQLFAEDQDAFFVYHDGFQNQVNKWPVNPLDVFIKQIRDKPKNLVIADFGCGEAKLAHNVPQKVYSFDLVALNDAITACDMSKTPLAGEQVDISVFCLSLMGTNLGDYIHEANRVLKTGGLLKIAEVVSRFNGLSRFTDAVCSYGFQLLNKRDLNQMFYMLDFKKVKFVRKSSSLPQIKLKPCIYKRR